MLKEAVYHKIDSDYSYALSKDKFLIKLRVKKGDLSIANLIYVDKYMWIHGDKRRISVPMVKVATDDLFDYYEVIISFGYSILYCFEMIGDETLYYSDYRFFKEEPADRGDYFIVPYICEKDIFVVPEWANEAIFYQIFPDRFCSGGKEISDQWYGKVTHNTKLGGNIRGIIEKLEYLDELGINAIYLTPVFRSDSCHKYDTIDYLEVDPEFGTTEELKELTKKAHEKGIKIIFDAVFNHSSPHFFAFKDILEKGESSKYKNWYDIKKYPVKVTRVAEYPAFAYYGGMPKLMTKNEETAEYFIKVAEYWIKETDIDGWRLDVANEVDHAFWRNFRDRVKKLKKDFLIVGELWHESSEWLKGDQFDSVMNYMFTYEVWDFFAKGKITVKAFDERLNFVRSVYRLQTYNIMWNMLDSHDTERFLNMAKQDKDSLKIASLFQMTYTGNPVIYYGDEVGMDGGADPDNRRGMLWGDKQDTEMLEHYKKIIKIRKNSKAFTFGTIKTLLTDNEKNMYGFKREYEGEEIYVFLNNSKKSYNVEVEVTGDEVEDLLTGNIYKAVNGKIEIDLKKKYGVVLKRR